MGIREMAETILIVEDDTDINNLIKEILTKQGYDTMQAFSGTEAAFYLKMNPFQLMILDLMLPGLSGEELMKQVREEMSLDIPVLILSAKNALSDKVSLLTGGADDYLTKPFEPAELVARVCVLLRRRANREENPAAAEEQLRYKDLCLYPKSRRVTVKENELQLTPHEFDILYLLVKSPSEVFSRERLYEQVWNNGYYGEDNTVNVHVSNIRKKIAVYAPEEEYIKTVWGIGFKMNL